MRYKLLGIKEYNGTNHHVDILINDDNESRIRDFLNINGILVINLEEFYGDINLFGNIRLLVVDEKSQKKINIISKIADIRQAYIFFFVLGLEIFHINYNKEEDVLADTEIKKKVEQRNIEITHLLEVNKEKTEDKDVQSIHNRDQKISGVKKIAQNIVLKAEVFVKEKKRYLSTIDVRRLEHLAIVLNKVKLGSNEEKIYETLRQITNLLSKMEHDYIDKIQKFEKDIFEGSVVSNVDIIKEIDRYKHAKQTKKIYGKKSNKDQYFLVLGKIGIYRDLLWMDIKNHFKHINTISYIMYKIINYIIFVMIIMLLVIYVIGGNAGSIGYYLIDIGLLGVFLFLGGFFIRKHDYIRNIGIFILAIMLYIILVYLLYSTLAL